MKRLMLKNVLFKKDIISYTGSGNTHTASDRAGTASDPYLDASPYDDILVSGMLLTTNTLSTVTMKLMGATGSTSGATSTTIASITGITGSEVTTYGTPFAIEIEGAKLGNYQYVWLQGTFKGTDPDGKMKTFYRLGNPRHAPVTQTAYGSTLTSVG